VKKAGNEQVKLQATFFNNLGVGSYIAGAVAPAVPFYQNFPFVDIFLRDRTLPPLPDNLWTAVFLGIWCIGMATLFQHLAQKLIAQLDD
jgi:hypothetical protein